MSPHLFTVSSFDSPGQLTVQGLLGGVWWRDTEIIRDLEHDAEGVAQRAALSWQRRGKGSPKGVLNYLLAGYKYNRARHFLFAEVHRVHRSGGNKHKVLAWKGKC